MPTTQATPAFDLAHFNSLLDNRQYKDCLDDLANAEAITLSPVRQSILRASAFRGQNEILNALNECNASLTAAAEDPKSQDTIDLAVLILSLLSELRDFPATKACLRLLRKIDVHESLDLLLWEKNTRAWLAEWDNYGKLDDKIQRAMHDNHVSRHPFIVLNLPCSARDEMQSAIHTFLATCGERAKHAFPIRKIKERIRYRLAYMSDDFRHHATTYLIRGLIEQHDRKHFELIAVTWGEAKLETDDQSASILTQFDKIIDIEDLSEKESAKLLHDAEIDILVDLKGYTRNSRSYTLAYRPAPIQVNFLGFPGTMGTPFHDYLITDQVIVPPELKENYTEFIAWLPHCYQPNEKIRQVNTQITQRSDFGLHSDAFVFCCFNSHYKIHPEIFGLWCEILKNTPNSQLWLMVPEEAARDNIRHYAAKHGIDSERIVFTGMIRIDQHLERLSHADLFLDTFPIAAHTTASDALYAGVPVLTCPGEKFASRVAASLLTTLGVPELICSDFEDYFQKATFIAHHPEILAEIKSKINIGVKSSPLYDPHRFARNIEKAYMEMISRQKKGKQGDFLVKE